MAKGDDGEPKVIYRRYIKVLDHPQQSQNGTSTMSRHIKGLGCQKATRSPSIKRFMQEAVSQATLLILLELIYLFIPRFPKLKQPPNSIRKTGRLRSFDLSLFHASRFS